jgi:hypothetical protein
MSFLLLSIHRSGRGGYLATISILVVAMLVIFAWMSQRGRTGKIHLLHSLRFMSCGICRQTRDRAISLPA